MSLEITGFPWSFKSIALENVTSLLPCRLLGTSIELPSAPPLSYTTTAGNKRKAVISHSWIHWTSVDFRSGLQYLRLPVCPPDHLPPDWSAPTKYVYDRQLIILVRNERPSGKGQTWLFLSLILTFHISHLRVRQIRPVIPAKISNCEYSYEQPSSEFVPLWEATDDNQFHRWKRSNKNSSARVSTKPNTFHFQKV